MVFLLCPLQRKRLASNYLNTPLFLTARGKCLRGVASPAAAAVGLGPGRLWWLWWLWWPSAPGLRGAGLARPRPGQLFPADGAFQRHAPAPFALSSVGRRRAGGGGGAGAQSWVTTYGLDVTAVCKLSRTH